MIVPMKKVTILCLAHRRDETLDALRHLGVMHLSHVQAPHGEDVDDARKHMMYLRRALEVLPHRPHAKPSGRPAWECVEHVWEIIHEHRYLEETLEKLRHERERIEPFGSFDPYGVAGLRKKGVFLKLFQGGPKQELPAADDLVIQEFRRDAKGLYFIALGRHDFELAGFQEIELPALSLSELEAEIAEATAALEAATEHYEKHSGDYPAIAQIVDEASDQVQYLEARAGMGAAKQIAYLRGYCPIDTVEAVREAAEQQGWGLVVDDPAEDERVPTLLHTPAWIRPIKALYGIFNLTLGYEESDISAIFLVFFSLFFGMLVGDAGYGVLFLLVTLVAKKKFPGFQPALFSLIMITNLATIAWGVLTGTYFGIESLPAPLKQLKVEWLSDTYHMMELCFFIGAIHLTVAHAWQFCVLLRRRSQQAVAQAGWICSTWGMLFLARHLILEHPMPVFMYAMLGAGVVAVAVFMTPVRELKTEWIHHFMLPLSIVNNFVDIVSYLRLFAVGAATLAVAAAFNGMAGMLSGAFKVLAPLVLLFGHGLNMGMAVLGVMVHGVRLNTLEFSQHAGIEWKGVPYNPFCLRTPVERNPAAAGE